MRMKAIILTAAFALLAGCATHNRNSGPDPRVVAFRNYVAENRPKAEIGQIKWSEYYTGAYERAVAANLPGDYLVPINQMIWNSQQFESGKISREEFTYKRRDNTAQQKILMQRAAEAVQTQEQARTMQALQLMQTMQAMQTKPPAMSTIAPITPMQPAPAPQFMSQSVTAIWTGKQQQVQTVTNQVGWSCEYNYAGRTFWRTFVGTCPSNTQVQ